MHGGGNFMWILLIVQVLIIGLFFFLGWAIRYKKHYGLLSGFAGRSKEEQIKLIENGYPREIRVLTPPYCIRNVHSFTISFYFIFIYN